MSISDVSPSGRLSDATPMEWDRGKADRYTDNRDPKEVPGTPDPVNAPPHYKVGEMEAIDYIYQQLGAEGIKTYLEGNILKYMHRWRFKNGVEDLRKAKWYLDKLIMEEVQGG